MSLDSSPQRRPTLTYTAVNDGDYFWTVCQTVIAALF
jgi:hypothetical protein